MSRAKRRAAVALLAAALAACWAGAQGNQGVIISEVAHGPSLPPVGGVPMPSYIELVNVKIANPTIPIPVPIGMLGANAIISAVVNNNPAQFFSIPAGLHLGGNVQPPPAAQPPTLPTDPPVLVIASAPFPPGVLPAGITPVLAPGLFSGPNAQLGAPGAAFEICFFNPATNMGDRIHLGPAFSTSCPGGPFTNTNTFTPTTGKAIRWIYVDSNTDIDFDPAFGVSPGAVNPQMAHVNGFFFGTLTSPALGGVPLALTGTTTAGVMGFPATARVKAVHFMNSFFNRQITNPAFDPVINAPVFMSANFTAQPPAAMSAANFLPGLQIANETMTITAPGALGPGLLDIPMGLSTQVGTGIGPSAASPTDIRPERIFTDMISDAAAFVSGSPSAVEVDVIPPSTGGGNTWCEIIVYDYQGNQYRAKVKNWPSNGQCAGPMLGLGTDGAGSATVIDLCFNQNAMVANVFSATPAMSCGGPLIPLNGICPDAVTAWVLTPPQLGAAPYFVNVDAGGVYLFQVPAGTLVGLIGVTFEGIAVEYTAQGAIIQQSLVNSITF
jgi:hypothetical protein